MTKRRKKSEEDENIRWVLLAMVLAIIGSIFLLPRPSKDPLTVWGKR